MEKIKRYVKVFTEQRGEGVGVGGERQRDGGSSFCVCPSCGGSFPHERGIPCVEQVCPSCGEFMTGDLP